MRTKPIRPDTASEALPVLMRGFPQAGEAFWRRGLARIAAARPEGAPDEIGVLVEKDGEAVGVLLALPSARRRDGEWRQVVNFSSWYLDPPARAFALMMLRKAAGDPATIYTDLTASPSVARMLPALGFRPIGGESMRVPTLRVARPGRRGALLTGADFLSRLDAAERRLAEDHLALGCLACGLEADGAVMPLVFLPRMRRRIVPTAELVYAPSRRAVLDRLPLVAAFLAARGKLFLEMDLRPGESPAVPHIRKQRGERFAKGPYPEDAVDFAYSELVYLGV